MACAAALWLREAPRYRARVVRQVCATTAGRALPKLQLCRALRGFCGAQALWRVESCCGDAREERSAAASRTRVATKLVSQVVASRGSASPQARRRVEAELEKCPQDCSRSSHRLLAVASPNCERSKAGEAAVRTVQAQRCTGGKDCSADRAFSTPVQRDAAFSRN